jgi:hypothetical protein
MSLEFDQLLIKDMKNHHRTKLTLMKKTQKIGNSFVLSFYNILRSLTKLDFIFLFLLMFFSFQLFAQGKVYVRNGDETMHNNFNGFNYFENGDEITIFKTSTEIPFGTNDQWTVIKTDALSGQVSSYAFSISGFQFGHLIDIITYSDNSYIVVLKNETQFCILKFSNNNILQWKKLIEFQTTGSPYYKDSAIDNGQGGLFLMISEYSFSGIVNIDNNGNILWSKIIEGGNVTSKSPGFSICRNLNGGVTGTLKDESYQCIFCLDQNGQELWSKTFVDSEYRWPKKIIQKSNGNYLIGGLIGNQLYYFNELSSTGELIYAKKVSIDDVNNPNYFYLQMQDLKLDNLGNQYVLFVLANNETSICKMNNAHQIVKHEKLINTEQYAFFASYSNNLGFSSRMAYSQYHLTMKVDENLTINCPTISLDGLSIIDDLEMMNATLSGGAVVSDMIINVVTSPTITFPSVNNIQINDYCDYAQIADINPTTKIQVFPNPASQTISILVSDENTVQKPCSIIDASGREVKTFILTETETQLDISDLYSGIYFLQFAGKVERFVVE